MNNRVICVDDEKDIVQAYVDFLAPAPSGAAKVSSRSAAPSPAGAAAAASSNSYEILKAYSGEEAIALVKSELAAGRRIAGGFFDVKMEGGIDGIQTIQELWKIDPGLNCTIVTAYQDRSVQDINQLFGPDHQDQWDYLNKPFTQGEIVQKARQMTSAWNRREMLKATQEQLLRSERMAAIGQVARGVGHEFGNILQRIVGKADLSINEKDQAKLQENLKIILQATERAAVIVRNLQAFSKGSNVKTAVDVGKVIGDTLALMNHELMKHNIKIDDKRQQAPTINGNVVELQQVLMNLMINSMHAMPNGGTLQVGAGEKDGAVVAWVTDTGTGIPPEVLPRIFEYAFTTKGDKGSGLGLSISKQIIEGHGGTITVQSQPGKGTSFVIRIPK